MKVRLRVVFFFKSLHAPVFVGLACFTLSLVPASQCCSFGKFGSEDCFFIVTRLDVDGDQTNLRALIHLFHKTAPTMDELN